MHNGRSPLKSFTYRSKEREDLIRVFTGGLKKRGLSSLHILQSKHTLLTSSTENGKFLERTKCYNLLTLKGHKLSWSCFKSLETDAAQKARVNVSGPTFSLPGRY